MVCAAAAACRHSGQHSAPKARKAGTTTACRRVSVYRQRRLARGRLAAPCTAAAATAATACVVVVVMASVVACCVVIVPMVPLVVAVPRRRPSTRGS